MILFGIIAQACYSFQFLAVLVLGKRIEILNRIIAAYVQYVISWQPYFNNLTDEKPDITPKF